MVISVGNLSSDKDYLQFSKRKTPEFKAQHPQKTAAQIDRIFQKQWSNIHKQTQSRGQKSSPSRKTKSPGQKNIEQIKESADPVKRIEFQSERKPIKALQKIEEKVPSLDEQIKEASESIKSVAIKAKKQRKIQKRGKSQKMETEYVKFYRYYFQRLHLQHPKWSNLQITQIIKLLWRKKNLETQKVKSFGIQFASIKRMGGRPAFSRMIRSKGASEEEARASWKQLPRQSKNYWKSKGFWGFLSQKRTPQSRIVNSTKYNFRTNGGNTLSSGPLGFLRRVM